MLTIRTELMPILPAGEIVRDVTLSAEEIAQFNEARGRSELSKPCIGRMSCLRSADLATL